MNPPSKRALQGWCVAALVCVGCLHAVDFPLKRDPTPFGIVSLQLALDENTARTMVESWSADEKLLAAFGLGFDYLFMVLYAGAIASAVAFLAHRANRPQQARLAWLAVGAALADVLENLVMMPVVLGHYALAPLMSTIALVKFALVTVPLVYVIFRMVRGTPAAQPAG